MFPTLIKLILSKVYNEFRQNILVRGVFLFAKIVSLKTLEPRHEISNNVVCATSKGSDQPAHMRSLIRAFASRLNIL